MKQIILSFFLLCFTQLAFSQIESLGAGKKVKGDDAANQYEFSQITLDTTSTKAGDKKVAKIEQYLIISNLNDTTYVDTTLSIQKQYKFNYLRKDNFNLMKFSNMGQSYNTLSYNFKSERLMPDLGARGKSFAFRTVEDVSYYHVPTPLTELFYRTGFKQGQVAQGFFSVNLSEQFNFSVSYKGLRSLGNYQSFLASSGDFEGTFNYKTKNERYIAKVHFVSQYLENEENGGLTDEEVGYFESGDPEFLDRGVFDMNFQDADNVLKGKRFHLDHRYYIVKPEDSLAKHSLNITHIMTFDDKYFEFNQETANDYFGESFITSDITDRSTVENFYNQLQLNYNNAILGDLQFNVSLDNYNYGYDQVVILEDQYITNRLKGNVVAVGGKYHNKFGGFDIYGDAGLNVTGDFSGNYITGKAAYQFTDDILMSAEINHNASQPNYNFLLFQSDYLNYNWQTNFSTEKTQQLSFKFESEKLLNLTVDYSTVSDYAYFKNDEEAGGIKPFQDNGTITYLRVRLDKKIKFGDFALDNTILYQNVQDGDQVLNMPDFVTRNTLYYSKRLFKKALLLETGITFNYFSNYYMDAYDPLLGEFYVQTDREFGNFPRFDFFLNAKIQQTRIYFEVEHFNAAFSGYDYFSAPYYPYRDLAVRFGIVWNFFM
ncbi:putative porin [Formosa sp. PL04]|uniref:putative porin n=1 Tax=Formosa sp. PL04 TaxID=3081755 RepID=UPI002982811A|nr:putative porin [Formosa sp. PL04]MDW5287618.1 putative porin [Formosa sp. PL04]